jgi:acyl-CoA synthetase (AMP-forming)/AMP-acid ligase II
VAITIGNDLESVLAVLGIWTAGATALSLPPPPRNSGDWYCRQFGSVLSNIGCGFLVSDDDQDVLASAVSGMRVVRRAALAEPGEGRPAVPDLPVPATALVQFTSGSIGTPKGVAIGSATLAGHIAAVNAEIQPDQTVDRALSWLPLYHDMGLIVMLCAIAAHTDQVLARPRDFAVRPASWLTALAKEKASITAAPNVAYRLAAACAYPSDLDLSGVRISICGAERVSWQTLQGFQSTAGPLGFRWEAITPGYGLAEGTVGVTFSPIGRGPLLGPGGNVSLGKPLSGVALRIPSGSGLDGPIHLGGDWLFSGYHTASGFTPATADGWFDTGDAGFVADGELYVLGRRDEVLTLGGRNVFAEDVEIVSQESAGALVAACAAFRNPAVTDRFGLMVEVNPRLIKDRSAAEKLGRMIQVSVIDAVGTRLAPVLVVRSGVIPRTTSGKVRRAQCRVVYNSGQISDRIIAELS